MTQYYAISAAKTLKQTREDVVVRATAVDLILTLPPSNRATRGKRVTYISTTASGGVGVQINPSSGDFIKGAALSEVVDKNLINTGATDVAGDLAALVADGAGSWWIVDLRGIWAKEA